MCVNDAFVMNAWGKELGIEKVKLIPDGDGKFTMGMDMLVHKPAQGFGYRSWRYAMTVNDGEVDKMWIEDGKNQLNQDNLDDKARYIVSHKIDCLSRINLQTP